MGGVTVERVVFQGHLPDLAGIAQAVSQRCGLPVEVGESPAAGPEYRGDFYAFDGTLFFSCAPKEPICLWAFSTELQKDREDFEAEKHLRAGFAFADFDDPSGTQTLYLRADIDQEATLLWSTMLSLESLGGRIASPIPDDIRTTYSVPVTEKQLEKRLRRAAWRGRFHAGVALLLAPLVLLTALLGILWFIIKLPWTIWKLRRLVRGLSPHQVTAIAEDTVGRAGAETPSRIHLREDTHADWYEHERPAIEKSGFTIGRAYTIAEMQGVQLVSIFHGETGVCGALCVHPVAGRWFDLVAQAGDLEITVTNAPRGQEIDHRPTSQKVRLPGATLEALLSRMKELLKGEVPTKKVTDESFRQEVEEAYARDMDWRNSRGGVSRAEVTRVAGNTEGNFGEETIEATFRHTKLQELKRWHGEVMQAFGEASGQYDRSKEGLYFIVTDTAHPETFAEYLLSFVELDEKQVVEIKAASRNGETAGRIFESAIGLIPPAQRPVEIGKVEKPIAARIYLARG